MRKTNYLQLGEVFKIFAAWLMVAVGGAAIAQPTITSVSPNTGIPGASITITGTNFNSTASRNYVYFGAVRVTPSSASTTSLTVTLPTGALVWPVSVTDSATGKVAFSGQNPSYPMASFLPTYDSTYFNRDSMNFKNKVDFAVTSGSGKPIGAAIGDINGDGKPDLVSNNSDSSSVSIFLNNSSTGSITSSSFTLYTKITLTGKPNYLKLVDIDGDGKLDIVAALSSSNNLNIVRNTTTSSSTPTFATRVTVAAGAVQAVLSFADFNMDGKADIAVSLPAGGLGVLKNTSTPGSISFATLSAFSSGSVPSGVYVGDFDGDGLPDVVTANSGFTGSAYAGNTLSVFRNTTSSGSISFASATTLSAGSGSIDVVAADFNNDGKTDIASTNFNDGTFSVFLNTGTSTGSISFGSRTNFTAGTGATGINVADLNADGKMDVVVSNAFGTSISIFRNTTSGSSVSFATQVTKTTGTTPSTLNIGDLDADNYPDIVVGNQSSNTISVFKNYPLPNSAITGTTTVCVGSTTNLFALSGGTWSITPTSTASISTSGVVNGIAVGTATVSYRLIAGGDTSTSTQSISVLASVSAGAITGTLNTCPGGTSSLANSTATGTGAWTTSNAAVASVSSTGVVTGVAAGSATITYTASNSCSSATTTASFTVNSGVSAGTISGAATVCEGASTSYTSTVSGGTWSTSDAAVASVSATGSVTGIAGGSATITYTVTTACGTATATQGITVNPLPNAGSLSGTSIVCEGATNSLTASVSGGTWSSSDASQASVDASGTIYGISAGAPVISYTVSNSCGSNSAIRFYTVNPAPHAGTISGTTTVCASSSTTLSSSVSGGSWTTSDAAIASVNTTGDVTGITAGAADITYSYTNSCGTDWTSTSVTVNPLPVAGTISGTASVCEGATTALSTTGTGGSWSTSDVAIANVDGSGTVSGVAAGSVTISYSVTNSCGTDVATQAVTVNPTPNPGTVTSVASLCAGSSLPSVYSGTIMGSGTWTSDNASVASVNASAALYGFSAGTTNVTYTVTTVCGSASVYSLVTVIALPSAGTISGTATVCEGATTSLSTTGTGGTWSTSDAATASVDASGTVTGIAAGGVTISYSYTNTCGTDVATQAVTVNPAPHAGAISGTTTVCAMSSTSLSAIVTGGTWSTSDAAVASVDGTGSVYGVAAGSASVTYSYTNGCGTDWTTASVTVNPLPAAGTISGATSVCAGASTTLSSTVSGGTWSSSATGVASVNATTGSVSGVSAGTATISYSYTNSCGTDVATYSFTVNPLPVAGSISGTASACVNASSTLTASVTGGTWSSSNTSVATVSTAGVVTGLAAGSATISYGVTNGCGTTYATSAFTVNPLPNAGTISGATTLCVGSTTNMSTTGTGGTWISTQPTRASITAAGVLRGVAAGADTVLYVVTNSCGTATSTYYVTIVPASSAGTLTSVTGLVIGASATIYSTVSGGTWSLSNNVRATITSAGVITGLAGGTDSAIYSVTTSCGTSRSYRPFTVTGLSGAGTISGPTTVCLGSTITLTSTTSGGTWTTSYGPVASVGASTGVVRGNSVGIVVVTYTVGSSISTYPVSVGTSTVSAISGAATICPGASTTFTDATAGGTWSNSTPARGSISSALGVYYGISSGTDSVIYTVVNGCGTFSVKKAITVTSPPSVMAISGAMSSLCVGSSIVFTNTSTGVWSFSNPTVATISAISSPSVTVTGMSNGLDTLMYTVTGTCGLTATASRVVTVTSVTGAGTISGATTLCAGSSTTLASTISGGTWTSVPASRASISSGGVLTGISAGADTVTYTVSGGCGTATATYYVTINPLAATGTLSTVASILTGRTATITSTVSGGTWSLSNYTNATISTGGVITGVAAGTDTAIYTVTNSCGPVSAYRAFTVTSASAAGTISGPSSVCLGSTITLSCTTTGGTWSSSYAPVASVNSSTGVVRGNVGGTVLITYTVGSVFSVYTVTVATSTISGISGPASVCRGTSTTYSAGTAGATWSNVRTSIGTINATTGVYTGLTAGSDSIVFTLVNACGTFRTYKVVTVVGEPTIMTISGTTGTVCVGRSLVLTNSTAGGTWAFSNPTVASISAISSPSVTVVGLTPGIDSLSYTVTNSCGFSSVTNRVITTSTTPTVGAGATSSMIIGSSATLTNSVSGGVWSTVFPTIASVNATTGAVRARAAGLDTIKYKVTNTCGTATAIYLVTVTASKPGTTEMGVASANDIKVYPNPSSTGIITIEMADNSAEHTIMVLDVKGRLVKEQKEVNNKFSIDLSNEASGVYVVRINTGGQLHEVKVIKE